MCTHQQSNHYEEGRATTQRRRKQKTPPEEEGEKQHHPHGRESSTAPRMARKAAPPERGSQGAPSNRRRRERESSTHPKEGWQGPPPPLYFNVPCLVLIWFNLSWLSIITIFFFMFKFEEKKGNLLKEEAGDKTAQQTEWREPAKQHRRSENSNTSKKNDGRGAPTKKRDEKAAPPKKRHQRRLGTQGERGAQHHPKGEGRTTTVL